MAQVQDSFHILIALFILAACSNEANDVSISESVVIQPESNNLIVNSVSAQVAEQDLRVFSDFLKELSALDASGVYLVPKLNGDFDGEDPVLGEAAPALLVNMIGYFLYDDAKAFTERLATEKKEIGYWDRGCEYVVLFRNNKRKLSFEIECNVLKERVLFRVSRTGSTDPVDVIYGHTFSEWIISRLVKVKSPKAEQGDGGERDK